MQELVIEILDVLAELLFGFAVGLSDADNLQKRGAVRIGIFSFRRRAFPEPVHNVFGRFSAEIAEVCVGEIALVAIIPGR